MLKKRFLYILCVLFILLANNYILAQDNEKNDFVTIQIENKPLREILQDLSAQTNRRFVFEDELIKGRFITCKLDNVTLEQALVELLKNINISFTKISSDKIIVLHGKSNVSSHIYFDEKVSDYRLTDKIKQLVQEFIISGSVLNINTHQEISGVNIFIRDTKFGTTTDESGKYFLRLTGVTDQTKVIFQHVAYKVLQVSLDSLKSIKTVYLQPRIIPLQSIQIEGITEIRGEITKDLPQPISIIEAKTFEMRGFVDAGDLLRIEHSVQVDEELSGKKTVAIRGGNPDEVVVMYNGVKMNSTYDNVFDFSLIDLDDIQRVEVIKGSNTSLYGPEAFSGVVNIIPRLKQDYNIRFQQRLGTYRSGNWGVHFYQDKDQLQGTFSFKRGAYKRGFIGSEDREAQLINNSNHHKGYINFDLTEPKPGKLSNSIGGMWLRTFLEYDNQRDLEKLKNENHLYSLLYSGDILVFKNLNLSTSFRKLDETQSQTGENYVLARDIEDESIIIRAENHYHIGLFDLLFAYNYQNSKLVFSDLSSNMESFFIQQPDTLESSELRREHHGFASIVKFNIGRNEEDIIYKIDLDLSIRYDQVQDKQLDPMIGLDDQNVTDGSEIGFFNKNKWQKVTSKISVNFSGFRENFNFNSYINYGKNVKFPTLFQQIGIPYYLSTNTSQPNLNPEQNSSTEIGVVVTSELPNHPKIFGWQVSGNYFMNEYKNKFRSFSSPNVPIAYYDNVLHARISGIEAKNSLFLLKKKVTFEIGLSRYSISEKAAFPFKSDFKTTLNIIVDHGGWAFQIHMFKENEQAGWLRYPDGDFVVVTLPKYSNIDFHISKKFGLFGLMYFMNFSGRNLLDDDLVLQGLAIRDRRFYLTIGIQY